MKAARASILILMLHALKKLQKGNRLQLQIVITPGLVLNHVILDAPNMTVLFDLECPVFSGTDYSSTVVWAELCTVDCSCVAFQDSQSFLTLKKYKNYLRKRPT